MLEITFEYDSCQAFLSYMRDHGITHIFKNNNSKYSENIICYSALDRKQETMLSMEIRSKGAHVYGLSCDPDGGMSGDYSSKGDVMKALRQLKVDDSALVALKNLRASQVAELNEENKSEGDLDIENVSVSVKKPKSRFIEFRHPDFQIKVEPVINHGYRDSVSLGFKLFLKEREDDNRAAIFEKTLTENKIAIYNGRVNYSR